MSSNEAKVWVRMPREVHEVLVAMAEKDRRSVNAQILVILERAASEHQRCRKTDFPTTD